MVQKLAQASKLYCLLSDKPIGRCSLVRVGGNMCQEREKWDSRNILSKAKMMVPRMFSLEIIICDIREEPVVGQLSRISGN